MGRCKEEIAGEKKKMFKDHIRNDFFIVDLL